ncbi:MAG: hypothetical protein FJ095_16415 [Deltaproteobacteria bacterium]|nr:hypothetical protein [Deltaproteobacteria bacterium]
MKFLASAVVLLTPALAMAHPGHGTVPGNTLAHWIAEPAHALGLVVGLALIALVAQRRPAKPGR